MSENKKTKYHRNFSRIIKNCRGCMPQREFAQMLSDYFPEGEAISQGSISGYENQVTLPSAVTLYAISKYTGKTADELLAEIFEN